MRRADSPRSSIACRSSCLPAASSWQSCRSCRVLMRLFSVVLSAPKRFACTARTFVTCSRIDGAAGAVGAGGQLLERHRRHLDVQVDAVQQRPADTLPM